MSTSIQTVEFERREAHLSELEEGPPYTVHGVALGDDDVTVGQSGIKKLWPADELEKSADSLEGKNLVVDHNNDSSGVVGHVTKAGYKDGTGVIYEAELFDDDLAEKINNGLLEVSIRGRHSDVEQMEESDDGAKVVEEITFANLSIVPTGAAPSNTIEMGETEELSVAELAEFTSQMSETAELAEIEPGMWVTSGDVNGITISTVEDGEIEVDVYEESDGKWRAVDKIEMMDVDSLDEWDVDEEDIAAMEDESENDEEEASVTGVPDNLTFDVKEDAMSFIEDEEGLTGVHEMDGKWIPGADHDEYTEWQRDQVEQMAAEGDKVQWDSSGGMARGVVIDRQTDGCFEERIDGDVKVCAEEDDAALLINVVQETDNGYEKSGQMVAHKQSTVEETDFSLSKHKMDEDVDDDTESESSSADFEDGMKVQWQVNPDMFGQVVHVDDSDEMKVMVEVMEMEDGEMVSTGHTVSAGFSDLVPMRSQEEMADNISTSVEEMSDMATLERFSDYPDAASKNAQMALDARDDTDNPNDCGTDVGWKRANQLANGKGLTREQIGKMSAFNRHRQNSEMDDEEGKSDCGWMMWKAWGGDEGVDWAQEKLDSIEEEASHPEGSEKPIDSKADQKENREQSPERFPDEVEELQDYDVHSVDFSGTTEGEWSSPDMEDFDTDDLSEIDDHFIISSTGFPPENFTDLKLPIVEPNGDLNVNALAAVKGGRGVSAVDGLSADMEDDIVEMVNNMANEEFDRDWGMEEAAYGKRKRTVDDTGDEPAVKDDGPVEIALDLINKYLTIEGNHERDTVDNMLSWLMGSVDIPMETLGDFRVAATRFLDETPGTDSFDGLTVEQFRDWLLMHGHGSKGRREQSQRGELPRGEPTTVNVLTGDDLRQLADKSEESETDTMTTKVFNMNDEIEQKLAELSEPVAVEQTDLEELQEKADRFEEMSSTLESLKERTDILDEVDRSAVEELADADEPVVVESARMESLEGEAEQVKKVYAAALSDEFGAFDAESLAEKFSIDELREEYEELIGDPAEELASSESAEPKSGDVDEEELEERAEADTDEEELSSETDEAEAKRDELRSKILG